MAHKQPLHEHALRAIVDSDPISKIVASVVEHYAEKLPIANAAEAAAISKGLGPVLIAGELISLDRIVRFVPDMQFPVVDLADLIAKLRAGVGITRVLSHYHMYHHSADLRQLCDAVAGATASVASGWGVERSAKKTRG